MAISRTRIPEDQQNSNINSILGSLAKLSEQQQQLRATKQNLDNLIAQVNAR